MRIAWLTPTDGRSAIAAYSWHVVEALRQHVAVDVWSADLPEAESGRAADIRYSRDPESLQGLAGYDVVVHNLGDHHGFHADIHHASRHHPGVLILHDRTLTNLFVNIYRRELDGDAGYLSRVFELYSAAEHGLAADALMGRLSRRWSETEQMLQLPFVELALAGQRGAVVHSGAHAEDVRRRWPGPLLQIGFPTYPEWLEQRPPRPRDRDRGRDRRRITLVTAGAVNRNKHVHDVIEALAADRHLAARVSYLVVGDLGSNLPYAGELAGLISRHALAGTVKLLGRQPPSAFARMTSEADVHINLRFPALEGGSASAAEQLASGRPMIVYDTGSYAELPDDAVIKIPPGDPGRLLEALRLLADNPARREELAGGARREAVRRALGSYATSLLEFLGEADRWPWRHFSDRIVGEMDGLGLPRDLAAQARVGRALAGILPSWQGANGRR